MNVMPWERSWRTSKNVLISWWSYSSVGRCKSFWDKLNSFAAVLAWISKMAHQKRFQRSTSSWRESVDHSNYVTLSKASKIGGWPWSIRQADLAFSRRTWRLLWTLSVSLRMCGVATTCWKKPWRIAGLSLKMCITWVWVCWHIRTYYRCTCHYMSHLGIDKYSTVQYFGDKRWAAWLACCDERFPQTTLCMIVLDQHWWLVITQVWEWQGPCGQELIFFSCLFWLMSGNYSNH